MTVLCPVCRHELDQVELTLLVCRGCGHVYRLVKRNYAEMMEREFWEKRGLKI